MYLKINKKLFLSTILIFLLIHFAKAGPGNIAILAKATASSYTSQDFNPSKINDGILHILDKGEWVSKSQVNFWGYIEYPWIQLDWNSPKNINKIVLFDRPNEQSHLAGGNLIFSDGSKIKVTEIPNDGSPMVIKFPSKKVDWIRFEVQDGNGTNLGLSEIEVYPSPIDYKDYISWVDPYIETTRGRYFFCVTGSQPFGMISASPLTRNKNQFGGGYNYNSTEILGFPQVHGWMLSGLTLMPTTGNIDPSKGEQNWKSKFSHKDEIIQPGYHRIFLKDHNILVEQTASDRVSFYRMTFTKDAPSDILLNLGGYVATSTMTGASVTKISNTEIEGSINTVGRLWGGPDNVKIFFVMQFSKPFESLDGWVDSDKYLDIDKLKGKEGSTPKNKGQSYHDAPTTGIAAHYTVKAGDQIDVKFSISYTSIKNARNNLKTDCNHWDFNKLKLESQKEWNQWLGKIDVQGGSDKQKIKFYTDIWHTLLGRHKIDDESGDYPDYMTGERNGSQTLNAKLKVRSLPKNSDKTVKFHMYNSDAFWLTQWNLNILWGLAWPEVLDEMSASLVQYADNGKLLPRGPNVGGYSYIMTGCPATPLIVSTFTKGLLTKVNAEHAYDVMKINHIPGGMLEANSQYINNGYFVKGWGSAGRSLEAAFQDWSLAQMAQSLGKIKDTKYFLKRSKGWRNLYNKEQQLIFPKDEDGNWLHNDPLSGEGWVEANSWQATWSVSHDIGGLSKLMGGMDILGKKLNYAFEQAESTDFVYGYGNGYISYANQPGCSNAHVFNHVKQPWLSQYWVRKVNEQAYGAITPDAGYGGHDEDQGQMGATSALMSLGLFSLRGTSSIDPVYELTSPVFEEITISLDNNYYKGEKFRIKTFNNSDKNIYIQKVTLNGIEMNKFWFYHSEFSKGGNLEIWLGPEPNKKWGIESLPQ